MSKRFFAAASALLALSALVACQDHALVGPQDARVSIDAPRADYPALVEIKFRESLIVRPVDGSVYSDRGASLDAVAVVLDRAGAYDLRPLFQAPGGRVDALLTDAAAAVGDRVPDLASWYHVTLPEGGDPDAVAAELRGLPEVEYAYRAPAPAPPPGFITTSTPDFQGYQGYFAAAPAGTSAAWARTLPGGDGAGVMVVDLEYDWYFEHEDLGLTPAILVTGERYTFFGDDHGTAVLGQLVAHANGFGVTGGVPGATARVASPLYSGFYIPALAIAEAASVMAPGDVLLLEQQTWGPNGQYVPLEWIQSVYEATLAATQAGRIVVAAAGNGGENLDAPEMEGRFDRNVRDSGAIIVGAGNPNRARLSFSCYGSRVDLHAWGMSVGTTGYGWLYGTGKNNYYTHGFSGTSSASPIVTAAVVAVQGRRKALGLPLMTSPEARALLGATGTPQTGNLAQHIGPFPNLQAALASFGPPAAPTSLAAGALTASTVQLDWAPGDGNAEAFSIGRRSQRSDGSWTGWQTIATVPVDSASFRDTGLEAGGTYRYRIAACSDTGCSDWRNSNILSLTPPVPPTEAAAAAASTTSATLTWTDASTDETRFEVARRPRNPDGTWSTLLPVGTRPANATSFVDAGLTPGTHYRLLVRACKGGLCSAWAVTPTIRTPVVPIAPADVAALPVSSSAIELTWSDASDNETGFAVDRRSLIDGTWSAWEPLATTKANVERYRDAGLVEGSRHRYRVRACEGVACSTWTLGTITTVPMTPVPPANLVAAATLPTGFRMAWTDASDNETGFTLQRRRRLQDGTWTAWDTVATPARNATAHDDPGLTSGAAYRYRIRACNGPACSTYAVSPVLTAP